MPMRDGIHNYPQVHALLQQDEDVLDYDPDALTGYDPGDVESYEPTEAYAALAALWHASCGNAYPWVGGEDVSDGVATIMSRAVNGGCISQALGGMDRSE